MVTGSSSCCRPSTATPPLGRAAGCPFLERAARPWAAVHPPRRSEWTSNSLEQIEIAFSVLPGTGVEDGAPPRGGRGDDTRLEGGRAGAPEGARAGAGRGVDARARHRCHHVRLLRRRRPVAAAAPLRRAHGPAGEPAFDSPHAGAGLGRLQHLLRRPARPARGVAHAGGSRGSPRPQLLARRHGRGGACPRRFGDAGTVRHVRRGAAPGTRLRCR